MKSHNHGYFLITIHFLVNKVWTTLNLLIQIFERGITQDQVILMAARASRTENQDAIDTAIVGMLADPKEVACFVEGFKWKQMIILLIW
jgi:hypothetical protein